MRDLVETVIAQVMREEPYRGPEQRFAPRGARPGAVGSAKSYAPASSVNPTEIKDEKLWDACCKFEAIFMQQMMQAMRKSIPKSDFLPQGFAEGVHDSMMDQAIAETGSRQGHLGLAMQMYRQLESSGAGSGEAIQGISKVADSDEMEITQHIRGSLYGKD